MSVIIKAMKLKPRIKSFFLIGVLLILGAILYLVLAEKGFLESQVFTSSSANSLAGIVLTSFTFLPGGLAISYAYLVREAQKNLLPNILLLGYVIAVAMLIPLGIFNLLINGL